MSISFPVPCEIRTAFERDFPRFIGQSRDDERFLERLRDSIGLRVFTLGLDDIGGDDIAPSRGHRGWLFLTGAPPDPVVAAEIFEPGGGAEPKVVNVSHEAKNGEIRRMAEALETLPETERGHYESRVLRIPALAVETFWLKADNPGEDLLVPFLTMDREFRMGRPYPPKRFLERLRNLGERTHPHSHEGLVGKS